MVRSGRFHGARLRGGIIGDQEVVFVGLIRRVKLSSLADESEGVSGMAGGCGDGPDELIGFSEEFRSGHWRWWTERVGRGDGLEGERRGDGAGGGSGLDVLSRPSCPGWH